MHVQFDEKKNPSTSFSVLHSCELCTDLQTKLFDGSTIAIP